MSEGPRSSGGTGIRRKKDVISFEVSGMHAGSVDIAGGDSGKGQVCEKSPNWKGID